MPESFREPLKGKRRGFSEAFAGFWKGPGWDTSKTRKIEKRPGPPPQGPGAQGPGIPPQPGGPEGQGDPPGSPENSMSVPNGGVWGLTF